MWPINRGRFQSSCRLIILSQCMLGRWQVPCLKRDARLLRKFQSRQNFMQVNWLAIMVAFLSLSNCHASSRNWQNGPNNRIVCKYSVAENAHFTKAPHSCRPPWFRLLTEGRLQRKQTLVSFMPWNQSDISSQHSVIDSCSIAQIPHVYQDKPSHPPCYALGWRKHKQLLIAQILVWIITTGLL